MKVRLLILIRVLLVSLLLVLVAHNGNANADKKRPAVKKAQKKDAAQGNQKANVKKQASPKTSAKQASPKTSAKQANPKSQANSKKSAKRAAKKRNTKIAFAMAPTAIAPIEKPVPTSSYIDNAYEENEFKVTPSTATSRAPTPKELTKSEFNFGGILDLSTTSNLVRGSGRQASTDLSLAPQLKFRKWTLIARTIVSKEMTQEERTLVDNTRFTLTTPQTKWYGVSSNIGIFGVAPTNELMYKNDTYRGAVGATNTNSGKILSADWVYQLEFIRAFHEYTINKDAVQNIQYRLTHTATLGVPIWGDFSLFVLGKFRSSWTYRNNVSNFYAFSQDIGYQINKKLSVYVGHGIEGDPKGFNGSDSNLKFYDPYGSTIHGGITYEL